MRSSIVSTANRLMGRSGAVMPRCRAWVAILALLLPLVGAYVCPAVENLTVTNTTSDAIPPSFSWTHDGQDYNVTVINKATGQVIDEPFKVYSWSPMPVTCPFHLQEGAEY